MLRSWGSSWMIRQWFNSCYFRDTKSFQAVFIWSQREGKKTSIPIMRIFISTTAEKKSINTTKGSQFCIFAHYRLHIASYSYCLPRWKQNKRVKMIDYCWSRLWAIWNRWFLKSIFSNSLHYSSAGKGSSQPSFEDFGACRVAMRLVENQYYGKLTEL